MTKATLDFKSRGSDTSCNPAICPNDNLAGTTGARETAEALTGRTPAFALTRRRSLTWRSEERRVTATRRSAVFLVEAVAEGATFLTVARLRSAAFAEGAMSAELTMTRPRMEAMRLTAVRKRCCIQVLQT